MARLFSFIPFLLLSLKKRETELCKTMADIFCVRLGLETKGGSTAGVVVITWPHIGLVFFSYSLLHCELLLFILLFLNSIIMIAAPVAELFLYISSSSCRLFSDSPSLSLYFHPQWWQEFLNLLISDLK